MGYRSETVNIVRYTNGTLVKITASADGFVSYDYNPDTNIGTFSPSSITLSVTYGGDLHFGKWEYSTDGEAWTELANGEHGIALNSSLLTVPASCDLFGTTNSQVVFRCVGDNPLYSDTATITREVDALQVYRTAKTQINQSNDKIALIASDEQLAYFTRSATFYNRYSNFEATAQGFMSTVTNTYATKAYADEAAGDALDGAKSYADNKFVDATTYTTKMQQTDNAISAQAGQITGLSTEVGTKARTYMQATAPTGAVTGDLWVNTSKNNEVSRYNGSAWVGVVNANAVVSQINQTAEQITISAQKIDFNGAISANGNFKITQTGDLEAKNATISGTIGVGGQDQRGEINIYNSQNVIVGHLDENGLIFDEDGQAIWNGTIMPSTTSDPCKRRTTITDGSIELSATDDMTAEPETICRLYSIHAGSAKQTNMNVKNDSTLAFWSHHADGSQDNLLILYPEALRTAKNYTYGIIGYGNAKIMGFMSAWSVPWQGLAFRNDSTSTCKGACFVSGCIVFVKLYFTTTATSLAGYNIAANLPQAERSSDLGTDYNIQLTMSQGGATASAGFYAYVSGTQVYVSGNVQGSGRRSFYIYGTYVTTQFNPA